MLFHAEDGIGGDPLGETLSKNIQLVVHSKSLQRRLDRNFIPESGRALRKTLVYWIRSSIIVATSAKPRDRANSAAV